MNASGISKSIFERATFWACTNGYLFSFWFRVCCLVQSAPEDATNQQRDEVNITHNFPNAEINAGQAAHFGKGDIFIQSN